MTIVNGKDQVDFVKRGVKGLLAAVAAALISNGALTPQFSDLILGAITGIVLAADRYAQNQGYY